MAIKDFAAREGMSVQRAAKLARSGLIPGAVKVRGRWVLNSSVQYAPKTRRPLSPQSRSDLITFFNTGTLDHVVGTRKTRLAERVRQFRTSADPVQLLKDWWGAETPDGKGGAALIRAAQRGATRQVRDMQVAEPSWILEDPHRISRRVSDYRILGGRSCSELAEITGIPTSHIKRIESTGIPPGGKRELMRLIAALGIPAVRVKIGNGVRIE